MKWCIWIHPHFNIFVPWIAARLINKYEFVFLFPKMCNFKSKILLQFKHLIIWNGICNMISWLTILAPIFIVPITESMSAHFHSNFFLNYKNSFFQWFKSPFIKIINDILAMLIKFTTRSTPPAHSSLWWKRLTRMPQIKSRLYVIL